MPEHDPRRPDSLGRASDGLAPDDFDRVLDGRAVGDRLDAVLGAARRVDPQNDSPGLDAALAAFTAARSAAGPVDVSSVSKARRWFAGKMLALAVGGAVATGGLAYAATRHDDGPPLPLPVRSSAVESDGPSGDGSGSNSSDRPVGPSGSSGIGSSTLTPSGSSQPQTSSGSGSQTAPASLTGLCNAWLARDRNRGNADNSAAFAVLVAAAGGAENVDAYCATLLGRPTPSSTPSSTPTPSTSSTSGPTGPPASTPPGQVSRPQSRSNGPQSR